jgi:hypothetical protein
MELFLVTATFWDDWTVVGIYDSHEKAEAAIVEAESLRGTTGGLVLDAYSFHIQRTTLNSLMVNSDD